MELFKLFGTIAVNNSAANSAIDETSGKAEKSEGKFSKVFSRIGSAAVKVGKVAAVGIGAAATGIAVMTKKAVGSYAEYEQLVGGVETLFKNSSDKVLKYANDAYKTAGLSANEYMDTVTSFSASLLQSLDGDTSAAADKANLAITDMSDNANKMGTSMESIQNAYQGFAKQNYTMLDNLKLGYGGTKEEMQRLLEDAEKISGQKFDLSSYADIVDAIHVVQTEMGITGTTSKEAATTIQGSVGMMKSSWQNLVTALANNNGDIDTTMNQFIGSVKTVGKNVIPVVETALKGIGTLVEKLAPVIIEKLPGLLSTILPQAVSAITSLINSLVKVLPSLIQMIVKQLPALFNTVASALIKLLPELLKVASEAILTIADGLSKALPKLLPKLVDIVLYMAEKLLDNIDKIIDVAIKLMVGLAQGLVKAIPKIVEKAPTIISKLVGAIARNLPKLLQAGIDIIVMLGKGLIQAIPKLVANIPKILTAINKGLRTGMKGIAEVGKNLITGLWNGISDAKDWIVKKVKGFGASVLGALKDFFGIHSPSRVMRDQIGKNLALGVAEGITRNKKYAKASAAELGKVIVEAAEKKLDKYKTYHNMTLKQEVVFWDAIRKQCKKGTDARLDADKKYLEAKKSLNSQLAQAEKDYAKQEKEINADLKKDIKSLNDEYKKSVEDRQKTLLSSFSLFESYKVGDVVSGSDLIAGLESQVNALEEWERQIAALKTKLGDTDLFKAIQEMGVNSLQQVKALNNMNSDQLQYYEKLYDERQKSAKSEAVTELESLRQSTAEKIDKITQSAQAKIEKAQTAYEKTCKKLGVTVAGTMEKIPKDTRKSMKSFGSAVKKTMESSLSTVKTGVSRLKKAMDFKWELPKIKVPKFKITGSFDLDKKSVPKVSVEWFKKAMNSPMIMNEPTAFGMTAGGKILAGGEAGSEVVSGTDTLMNMISEAVSSRNVRMEELLGKIVELLTEYMPQMSGQKVVMDTGALVGQMAAPMDKALGKRYVKSGRRV